MFDETILAGTISERSIYNYGVCWRAYVDFCGGFDNCLDPAIYVRWRDHMVAHTDYSPAFVRNCLCCVRRIIQTAANCGLVEPDVSRLFLAVAMPRRAGMVHRLKYRKAA